MGSPVFKMNFRTDNESWITPFMKQCFVSLGVSLNVAAHGLVMGFAAILLPQLRQPDSIIPIDDTSGSWIAAILGFSLIMGNFLVPTIMSKFGRKTANLISIAPMIVGWFSIVLATNITTLLVARFLQGLAMGMSGFLGPILIGEYTSPKNRGAFLTFISLTICTAVLFVHTLGSFFTWQATALVITFVIFTDLLIVLHSPESPSWLAYQGRYDECKKVFRWLRGYGEDDELDKLIAASKIMRETTFVNAQDTFGRRIQNNLAYLNVTLRKREFYKPIFIMVHVYTLAKWSGANIIAAYTVDIFQNVLGTDVDTSVLVITLDVQKILSSFMAVFIIRKIKRRTLLGAAGGLNIFAFLAIASYTYGKAYNLLPIDHPAIGIGLIHLHVFSIATGTIPLPIIIAGELFPLEYRSLAGGISMLFLSTNLFITMKTLPYLFKNIGIHGAYVLYASVVAYCLLIALLFLPETKDKTLLDIEYEFRRGLSPDELKCTRSLTSEKNNMDRRSSVA